MNEVNIDYKKEAKAFSEVALVLHSKPYRCNDDVSQTLLMSISQSLLAITELLEKLCPVSVAEEDSPESVNVLNPKLK